MSLPDVPVYLEVLPPKARKLIYAALILLGVVNTALGAFFLGSGLVVPWYFAGVAAALNSLMTGGFIVAITKVNAPTATLTNYVAGDVVAEADAEPDELPAYPDGLDAPVVVDENQVIND